MTKNERKVHSDILYETLLELETVDECKRFMEDLCTVAEMKAMEQRFEVALLLADGMIYNDILAKTGASSATISRVNRALHYGSNGYREILPRIGHLRAKYQE